MKRLREELEKNGFQLEYLDEEDKLINIQNSYLHCSISRNPIGYDSNSLLKVLLLEVNISAPGIFFNLSNPGSAATDTNIRAVSYFTGRETELQDLRQKIEEKCKAVLVSGMGGIGKTHICRKLFEEYYVKYKDRNENEISPYLHYTQCIQYNEKSHFHSYLYI